EAGRGRAGRPVRQSHRSARNGNRGAQSFLVRTQFRPSDLGRAAPREAFSPPMDGGDPRWGCGGDRGRIRGQVDGALVLLRRGRSRKVHGPSPAQHVGYSFTDIGALDHYWWRQMGGDLNSYGSAVLDRPGRGRKEILAVRPVG